MPSGVRGPARCRRPRRACCWAASIAALPERGAHSWPVRATGGAPADAAARRLTLELGRLNLRRRRFGRSCGSALAADASWACSGCAVGTYTLVPAPVARAGHVIGGCRRALFAAAAPSTGAGQAAWQPVPGRQAGFGPAWWPPCPRSRRSGGRIARKRGAMDGVTSPAKLAAMALRMAGLPPCQKRRQPRRRSCPKPLSSSATCQRPCPARASGGTRGARTEAARTAAAIARRLYGHRRCLPDLLRRQHERARQRQGRQFAQQAHRRSQRLQPPGNVGVLGNGQFDPAPFVCRDCIVDIRGEQFIRNLWIGRGSHL